MRINIVGFLERAYSYLPKLGPELKSYVVGVIPYLSFVFGLFLTLASVLEILGTPFFSLFSVSSPGAPIIQILLLTNAIGIFQGLLMIFAFGPLKSRRERGWKLLIWSQILWIISSALSVSSSLVIALIVLYPIMAIKSEYK